MDFVFNIIQLFGGLAFFLFGMNVMSGGLEKMAKGKLEKTLKSAASNKLMALIFGAVITIAIQSSSALTVMLVGLVNSGILEFGQTIGVLMGSNIGTTLTAWLLSLAGIKDGNFLMTMLKPINFSMVFAFIGIIMNMVGKKQKTKNIGNIFVGFAVLMFGMNVMSESMEPLTKMEGFTTLLTAFKNPFVAVAFGALFTGVIQSSAASVGILQTLAINSNVTFGMAIPIIMGQNIGTCVTALISSIGVTRNAKKVAVVHLSFNMIGTLILLIPYVIIDNIFGLFFTDMRINTLWIAIVHSIFNVATTLILLPFTKQLEKLANLIIKDKGDEGKKRILLDERLITVPSFAVTNALDVVMDMSQISKEAVQKAISLLDHYDEKVAAEIKDMETMLDNYEDQLGTYMVKISKIGVSDSDSKKISRILHSIDDFERIGDHAENLIGVAAEMYEKKIVFSKDATVQLEQLQKALLEIVDISTKAFVNNDLALAASVEPLEQVIDNIIAKIKAGHVDRLQTGDCTIELGFVLSDLLTNYERVSDHCSNVAVAIIESQHETFEAHEYLNAIKASGDFEKTYDEYKTRFMA